jgi:hypothetical protein
MNAEILSLATVVAIAAPPIGKLDPSKLPHDDGVVSDKSGKAQMSRIPGRSRTAL